MASVQRGGLDMVHQFEPFILSSELELDMRSKGVIPISFLSDTLELILNRLWYRTGNSFHRLEGTEETVKLLKEFLKVLQVSSKLKTVLGRIFTKSSLAQEGLRYQIQLLTSSSKTLLPESFTHYELFTDSALVQAFKVAAERKDLELLNRLIIIAQASMDQRPHFEAYLTVLLDGLESPETVKVITDAVKGQSFSSFIPLQDVMMMSHGRRVQHLPLRP
jgi:hypothetical protein